MTAAGETTPVAESSAAAVFRNRPFLLLWLSQLATQVGGNMVLYGLTVLVYGSTDSNSAVSILILTFLAPAVIFSALAGVYVDRFDRRLVLVATNLIRAALFVALAVFDANILLVFVLNTLVSVATTFFAPAELSMIPIVVPRRQLTAATGIFTLTLNAAFAIGFTVLGPLVVSVFSPTILIVVVAVLYLVAAGFCWTLPPAPPGTMPHDAALHEAEEAVGSFVQQFREGIAYVRAHPIVRWALLYLGIAASIVGILGVLGPGFAEEVLGLTEKDFVVVVLPLGVGVVTGALVVARVQGMIARRRLIEIGLIVLGVCLVLLSIAAPIAEFVGRVDSATPGPDLSRFVSVLTVVVAIAFVAGIAYAAVAIPAQTELQEEIPQAVRGRVFGILNMLVSVGSLLPIVIVGPISDTLGTMPVILFAATVILLVGILSVIRRGRAAVFDEAEPVEADASVAPAGRSDPGTTPGPSPDEP
jgi:MFS family permease